MIDVWRVPKIGNHFNNINDGWRVLKIGNHFNYITDAWCVVKIGNALTPSLMFDGLLKDIITLTPSL